MYTIMVIYRDETETYYEGKFWKLEDRYFCIGYGNENYDFIPTDKVLRINVSKDN